MTSSDRKILASNKKASHDYFINTKYEAGIVLTGTEIKSLRCGAADLKDSYAKVEHGEVFVFNLRISPYEKGNIYNTEPLRPKKLLLHKKEIRKLDQYMTIDGLALIPLDIYLKSGIAKVTLAVCKGKKLYDKREDIARRDASRDMERRMKDH